MGAGGEFGLAREMELRSPRNERKTKRGEEDKSSQCDPD